MHDDRWSPWIDALTDDTLFKGIETLATEYRVVDRYNSVAGSFDFLISSDAGTFLGDLKTVSSRKAVSSRKPATAQLGAYVKMLQQWQPKLMVTQCVTVVSGPERCKVIRENPEDCINAWEEARGRFQKASRLRLLRGCRFRTGSRTRIPCPRTCNGDICAIS